MHSENLSNGVLEHWTPEDLHEAMASRDVVLIDVRTPQEYAFEHIEGSLLAPLHSFDPLTLPTQEGKRLVFHCGSGMRSRKAAMAYIGDSGGTIAHLDGGFAAWKAAGMPYCATDPGTGGPRKVPGAL